MDQMQGRAEAGAKRGYLTASIDCRYHGRRCPPGQDKRDCYEHALVRSALASTLWVHPIVAPSSTTSVSDFLLACSHFLFESLNVSTAFCMSARPSQDFHTDTYAFILMLRFSRAELGERVQNILSCSIMSGIL